MKISNAIMTIMPYQFNGQWVFDDLSVGLVREPFVSGIDTMIDLLTHDFEAPSSGFIMLFSGESFLGADVVLEWRRKDGGGNWYWCESFQMEGWLCPALFKYFNDAPGRIYVQAKEAK